MADYHSTAVIQPDVPIADLSPLEALLLSHMVDVALNGDGLYLCIETGVNSLVQVAINELRTAHQNSTGYDSQLQSVVDQWLTEIPTNAEETDDTEFDFDTHLTENAYILILQDVLRRSTTRSFFTVNGAYTCTKMRPDGFGGWAAFVTPTEIHRMSTDSWIESMFETLKIVA
ncbi:hypothetical protein [Asticcacaulis sp. YBE204]|uniref:hypothetical protein n=1 Tax=Asticcacaulis sp. YBE204 TaxID=1282363 RepID=UPI0003C3CFAB|nr:hypothetical protein [Asticcacaulis sp. YBE204]ESQ79257.1 hypothetical protein AEYBE204_09615 [Asticcacaulis sp. YBE204]